MQSNSTSTVFRSLPFALSTLLLAATFLAALFLPADARAAKLAGVSLDDAATVGETDLVLNGLGLRKKFFVKVYVAGLYLPAETQDAGAVLAADEPRHLVMQFLREVDAASLTDAWNDCLGANSPDASAEVEAGFETLNGAMVDVAEGDRLAFTYLPGSGTSITVQGDEAATVEGKPFADALFACWIGETPPSDDFKEGLLGR